MSNRSIPNLEERLKHASEAKKSMLAKFKMSLVEGPAAIEKRQQRQGIAAARAERAVQREEVRLRQERDRASKPSLRRRQQPMPNKRRPSKRPEMQPDKQNVMRCLRLNRRRPAMPVTRHGRPPRSSGGGATSRCCASAKMPVEDLIILNLIFLSDGFSRFRKGNIL